MDLHKRANKVGNKIDNALDVANAINKVDNIQELSKITMVGRKMDRVTQTARAIGIADNSGILTVTGGSSMAVFLALGGCAVIYSMLSKMSSKPLQTKSA